MDILRASDRKMAAANRDWFTGDVQMARLEADVAGSRLSFVEVTFDAGARTNWHTHALGQTIFVTDGTGWVQVEGGPRETVEVGDVVHFPPHVRHWHGATAMSAMTHLAIAEAENGAAVDWQEPVVDSDYDS